MMGEQNTSYSPYPQDCVWAPSYTHIQPDICVLDKWTSKCFAFVVHHSMAHDIKYFPTQRFIMPMFKPTYSTFMRSN